MFIDLPESSIEIWLVVEPNSSENIFLFVNWMMKFPEWKLKFMFQTTNQISTALMKDDEHLKQLTKTGSSKHQTLKFNMGNL